MAKRLLPLLLLVCANALAQTPPLKISGMQQVTVVNADDVFPFIMTLAEVPTPTSCVTTWCNVAISFSALQAALQGSYVSVTGSTPTAGDVAIFSGANTIEDGSSSVVTLGAINLTAPGPTDGWGLCGVHEICSYTNAVARGVYDASGNGYPATAVESTSITNGFDYFVSTSGVPTGVPAHLTGGINGGYANAPCIFDDADYRIYCYAGGAWQNTANGVTSVPSGALPDPTASSLGGIESFAAVSHEWINAISTSGVPSGAQPAFSDISGTCQVSQGCTGTASPGLVQGTGITITGSWPDQTISATGSGSGTVNPGTAGDGAYYATSASAVSDASVAEVTIGALNLGGTASTTNGWALPATNEICSYTNGTARGCYDASGNGYPAVGPQPTNITNGFDYVATVTGVPTGTPANLTGGVNSGYTSAPCVFDNVDYRQYCYAGGAWQNIANGGTGNVGFFTGALTGMTATTNGTVNYSVNGNQVTLSVFSTISGTSNSTAMTMTGVPSTLWPAHAKDVACGGFENNGTAGWNGVASVGTSGTITLAPGAYTAGLTFYSAAAWVGSGAKGLVANWTITYTLDFFWVFAVPWRRRRAANDDRFALAA